MRTLIDGLGHATWSATYLSQASCVIVSGFRAALDLDTYNPYIFTVIWMDRIVEKMKGSYYSR